MLGCLIHVQTWSRPQSACAVSLLGSVASKPTLAHMKLLRHAVHHCKLQPCRGIMHEPPSMLTFSNEEKADRGLTNAVHSHEVDQIVTHVDASFASEPGHKSQSSFIIFMNGGPIHWSSVRQEFPALSSTEAELISGVHGLKPTLHSRELLQDLGILQGLVPFKFVDTNAIRFNQNEWVTKRNIHIGVRYYRVRYHDSKDIMLHYLRTRYMSADIGTKILPVATFQFLENMITHVFDSTRSCSRSACFFFNDTCHVFHAPMCTFLLRISARDVTCLM